MVGWAQTQLIVPSRQPGLRAPKVRYPVHTAVEALRSPLKMTYVARTSAPRLRRQRRVGRSRHIQAAPGQYCSNHHGGSAEVRRLNAGRHCVLRAGSRREVLGWRTEYLLRTTAHCNSRRRQDDDDDYQPNPWFSGSRRLGGPGACHDRRVEAHLRSGSKLRNSGRARAMRSAALPL